MDAQAVKDPLVKLFVWLVDWPSEITVDCMEIVFAVIVETLIVEPLSVETNIVEPVSVEIVIVDPVKVETLRARVLIVLPVSVEYDTLPAFKVDAMTVELLRRTLR